MLSLMIARSSLDENSNVKKRVYHITSFNTTPVDAYLVRSLHPRVAAQNMLLTFDAPHLDNYQSGSSFVRIQPLGIASGVASS